MRSSVISCPNVYYIVYDGCNVYLMIYMLVLILE